MKRLALIFLYVCLSTLILFGSTTQASGTSGADSLTYFDAVRFPVIGKIYPDSLPFFSRIPYFLKPTTREAVWNLGQNSAGIAVRFRSDSPVIAVKWENTFNNSMKHMAPVGIKGLDLYCFIDGKWRFVNSAQPSGKTNQWQIISGMDATEREYMLYLPLYDGIHSLQIGVAAPSHIGQPSLPYPDTRKPIVFYGSSITQGACASRPGMAATNLIGRKLNVETINLGFSGNAFIDYEVAEMMAHVDASAYVLDYVPNASPEQILEDLQKQIQTDFPAVPSTSYEVKYVHPDLEEHLSPAFYLTPPIDTLSPNDIYINRHANMSGLELYTTLAHEGFPGHLYQTITFASSAPDPVRYLPAMGGYVEGWATYAESFAYTYYQPDSTDGQLAWLNRSLNLCMMSLLDTVIHYNSWNQERCATFLSQLGITDNTIQKEIYQVIVEDPANYLKYYLGYLQFLDLQQEVRELAGDAFHLHSFHQKVLSAGPCQFPILKQWILTQYKT